MDVSTEMLIGLIENQEVYCKNYIHIAQSITPKALSLIIQSEWHLPEDELMIVLKEILSLNLDEVDWDALGHHFTAIAQKNAA